MVTDAQVYTALIFALVGGILALNLGKNILFSILLNLLILNRNYG